MKQRLFFAPWWLFKFDKTQTYIDDKYIYVCNALEARASDKPLP